jgi:tRNA-modifying protein YgfZ
MQSPPAESSPDQSPPAASPLLATAGAVPADGPDAGVAAHYGDPFAEQRALAGALGLVDRSHRGVIRIAGQDRLSWLHSLTTQDLQHLAPGSTAEALILSPNGHVEHHLTLTDDGTHLWAHAEPGTAAALLEFLESMRFMLRVEPADVSDDYAVLTVMGPGAGTAALSDWASATATATTRAFGMDVLVARDGLAAAAAEAQERGAVLAGIWAHEALRIAARRPRLGLDTDHRTIPHEVGWIGTAVHLNKGCYRGQETVARVHNLGHPPRRLVFLHLDGSEDRLPTHGDPVALDGEGGGAGGEGGGRAGGGAVGFVGSAARHYELGPIALALVKRTIPVDVTLLAAGLPAAQEVIVPPDAGANVTLTLRGGPGGRPPGSARQGVPGVVPPGRHRGGRRGT